MIMITNVGLVLSVCQASAALSWGHRGCMHWGSDRTGFKSWLTSSSFLCSLKPLYNSSVSLSSNVGEWRSLPCKPIALRNGMMRCKHTLTQGLVQLLTWALSKWLVLLNYHREHWGPLACRLPHKNDCSYLSIFFYLCAFVAGASRNPNQPCDPQADACDRLLQFPIM